MADYQWIPLTDEKKFEDLVNDLCSKKYGIEFQIYGRKGQKQYGIDGSALTKENKSILHQCKNKMISRTDSTIQSELLKDLETETTAMIKEFIEKKNYNLDKFIFANSFKRDTKLQDKATELSTNFTVVVWSWDDISDMLEEYTDIAKKYYPQSFNKTSNSEISPQLTTKLGKSTIIGREKELQEIDKKLKASNTLLVKGIGGVGKSTIASNYLHRHKDEYAYYGFFEGLESFESELEGAFKLEFEQGHDRLDRVLRELIKLEPMSKKLLVIDDVKEIKENKEKLEKILGLEHNGYRVLLTSREEIEDVEQYDLDVLSIDDAKELFNSIYKVEDEVLIEEILEYLDYHAFFIEMTAKTLKSKKTLTPDRIKEKFENGDFPTIKRKRKESFNDYLNQLFSFDKLDNEEILMLKQLSILPSVEIEFEFLQQIFTLELFNSKLEVDSNENFEELLNNLLDKGWLSSGKNGFKLHQIIKEYITKNHIPLYEEIKNIIHFFIVYISEDFNNKYLIKKQDIIYFDALSKGIETLNIQNVEIGIFFSHLGSYYGTLGMYNESEKYHKKSIEIHELVLGASHIGTTSAYNNLALLYQILGRNREAKQILKKIIYINKQELRENDVDMASTYNNLGLLYQDEGKYKDARKLFFKSLEIWKTSLGKNHYKVTVAYHNLGLSYKYLEEYKKSEFFLYKSLNIRKKILNDLHPEIAKTYDELAGLYVDRKMYDKAKKFALKGLKLRKAFFKTEHPDLATSYNRLSNIYSALNDSMKGEVYTRKSLAILKKQLGDYHIETISTYHTLGIFLFEKGDLEESLKYINLSLDLGRKILSLNHPILVKFDENLKVIENSVYENTLNLKPNRNDPCPCNSGKKYKKCCGKAK